MCRPGRRPGEDVVAQRGRGVRRPATGRVAEGPGGMTGQARDAAAVLSWAAARIPRAPKPGPGGLVDANSFLGEWPARRLNGSPPPERLELVGQRVRLMDTLGIRRAAVG